MQSEVDAPCPHCNLPSLTMLSMSSEIPYFGEHTQITVLCSDCGWRHTDFIPSDGLKPGYSSLFVDSIDKVTARVVRASSCTIRIRDLDLEVSPGGASTGYVTNIEGVISRFEDAVRTAVRGNDEEEILGLSNQILESLRLAKIGESGITVELLDPLGRSQIIHEDAECRELTDMEADELEIGPEIPVFEVS